MDPNAKGHNEECMDEDWWTTGMDDCERGSMCWQGRCRPFCGYLNEPPECEPASDCYIFLNLWMCMKWCHPLSPDCFEEDRCLFTGVGFQCEPIPVAEKLGPGEPCVYESDCAAGLFCGDASLFGGQCAGQSCCTTICETDLPDVDDGENGGKCPEPEMVCRDGFLDNAPDGFDRLGVCAIPG